MSGKPNHRPDESGYEEKQPTDVGVRDAPDPEAAGGECAQITGGAVKPDEEQDPPAEEPEPTPPGEHKREPIKDPDPADTKLYVRPASR
jgi:hypothetical protein